MARAKQLDRLTGSIGKLSFYTRKGSDEVFVRTKGGPTKQQIKRRPEFEKVRKNNKEFGGCSKMSKEIRMAFYSILHVADYNLAPAICSLMKEIQCADTESPHGERSILLTKYRQYLMGFGFNRIHRFESVLRVPIDWSIDRENTSAVVRIPEFACSMGLSVPFKLGLFRISATLGTATDHVLGENKYGYYPAHDVLNVGNLMESTAWFPVVTTVPAQELKLQLEIKSPWQIFNDNDTLILCIAVEFGTLDAFGNPTPVKGAGAGKILGVG